MSFWDWIYNMGNPPPEPAKEQKKKPDFDLKYQTQQFEVGVSTVLVIFDDGREVHTKFYGYVDQYVNFGSTYSEPKAFPPQVITSIDVYRNFIHMLNPSEVTKLTDDPAAPTVAWTGLVKHAEIVETKEHKVEYTVTTIVEVPKA